MFTRLPLPASAAKTGNNTKELVVNNKKNQTLNFFDMKCSGCMVHVGYSCQPTRSKTDVMSYGPERRDTGGVDGSRS